MRNLNRRKLRKMILKEMDMMSMGVDPQMIMQAFQTLLTLGTMGAAFVGLLAMLGPIMFHGFLDSYFRGLFSENEYKRFTELTKTDPEAAKRYADEILRRKGYDPGSPGGVPLYRGNSETGEIDASYAQNYTDEHGDIDFDPYDDEY